MCSDFLSQQFYLCTKGPVILVSTLSEAGGWCLNVLSLDSLLLFQTLSSTVAGGALVTTLLKHQQQNSKTYSMDIQRDHTISPFLLLLCQPLSLLH